MRRELIMVWVSRRVVFDDGIYDKIMITRNYSINDSALCKMFWERQQGGERTFSFLREEAYLYL